MPDVAALLDQFRQHNRLALSRLLSLLARGQETQRILSALPSSDRQCRLVAITGSAGVGKSSTIGKLIGEIRRENKTVAVLACDPQSPLSGGALLGDRFRMGSDVDDGLFIRSLPALSGRGAIAEHLSAMTRLLAAFGFDVILIETVGAGQGDIAVSDLADVVVLLLQPETGDDLQWEKAGVLEVADIIAVQKADLPSAEQVAAQVKSAVELSPNPAIPVLLVSAKTGKGMPQLWQAIATATPRKHEPAEMQELLQTLQETIAKKFYQMQHDNHPQLLALAERWHKGEINEEKMTHELLQLFCQ